ncbi:hypothetical protein SAMN04489712_102409 [Thermomonospora echinospora]|uniref:Alkaline shock response membrane anchor protein AmaP n=1 Tax=Thermomonospora echinospora TaxID=1992 RepID=A0A1H5VR40_9ACTN|nr:alkaline shock response membrane anchor protein AmaP [Thermomonospora echinospora]SEF89281.1 hypothetical protein SAMN04489712_102409 [Thermomonospora echinospora]
MDRSGAGLNRFGLTLVGLLLLAGGGLALARSLGAWGTRAADRPLLSAGLRGFPDGHPWFWPAVAAGAVTVTLLGLTWLFAQGRSEKLTGLSLEQDGSGVTKVSAAALTSAIEKEVEGLPGVEKTRARLLGSRKHPRLAMTVSYAAGADLQALRSHIAGFALVGLRTAVDRDSLPAVVKLRLVDSSDRLPEPRTPE